MKFFEEPMFEIVKIAVEDVITASTPEEDDFNMIGDCI